MLTKENGKSKTKSEIQEEDARREAEELVLARQKAYGNSDWQKGIDDKITQFYQDNRKPYAQYESDDGLGEATGKAIKNILLGGKDFYSTIGNGYLGLWREMRNVGREILGKEPLENIYFNEIKKDNANWLSQFKKDEKPTAVLLPKDIDSNATSAYTTSGFIQEPTPTPTPSNNGNNEVVNGGNAYIEAMRKAEEEGLKRAYDNAISSAIRAYQKSLNPYGVEAESLARAGLTQNGGYSQLMRSNAYNAYNQAINNAENSMQQGKNEMERELAYRQYLEDKENAGKTKTEQATREIREQENVTSIVQRIKEWINEKLNNKVSANNIWKGKVLRDDAEMEFINKLKGLNMGYTDNEIARALTYITKGNI